MGVKNSLDSYFKHSTVDQVSENQSVCPYHSRQACMVSHMFINPPVIPMKLSRSLAFPNNSYRSGLLSNWYEDMKIEQLPFFVHVNNTLNIFIFQKLSCTLQIFQDSSSAEYTKIVILGNVLI